MTMSIADTTHTPASEVATGRLFTIADVECLPKSLPSGDVDYELNNGRLIVVSPPGRRHSKVHNRISAFLSQVEEAGLGEAFTEVGVVLWRDPDRLVDADAAFVSRDRCPVRETKEGYLETVPDLAVEIRSKDDTLTEFKEKAADYLKAGVAVVWVIDPIARNASIYRPNQPPTIVAEDGVLAEPTILGQHMLHLAKLLRP
jgi:Uma2 family endonuclease